MSEGTDCFVGGLVQGVNYPVDRKLPLIDLSDCHGIILVDVNFFLENRNMLLAFASSCARRTAK